MVKTLVQDTRSKILKIQIMWRLKKNFVGKSGVTNQWTEVDWTGLDWTLKNV